MELIRQVGNGHIKHLVFIQGQSAKLGPMSKARAHHFHLDKISATPIRDSPVSVRILPHSESSRGQALALRPLEDLIGTNKRKHGSTIKLDQILQELFRGSRLTARGKRIPINVTSYEILRVLK
jgi:hypothetical protein